MSASEVGIVWLRRDLRVADHEAFVVAAREHQRILPVFLWAPETEGSWPPGAASRWWLHDSLVSLCQTLRKLGSDLVVRRGDPGTELEALARATGATRVYAHRRFEPASIALEKRVRSVLARHGVELELFQGALLNDPDTIKNLAGNPYLVFGAYWRAMIERHIPDPLPAPKRLPPMPRLPAELNSEPIEALTLKPKVRWDDGLRERWKPGEATASQKLAAFCDLGLTDYATARDLPGEAGTSRLSPHLHFGELSPRQAWNAARARKAAGATTFLKELAWREFSYYLLAHHPRIEREPLRREFEAFPWERDTEGLVAWQRGRTGFPIVDAGMRELWHTGWMHNRVRMIVASFLVKDLRVHWLDGARWFWDTLVDADLANNTQGWQWTAGCGADAAPYFRVFHPMLQGKKYDPLGVYVRFWVPEVADRIEAKLHEPYGEPIVDHDRARFSALKAFDAIKKKQ